MRRHDKSVRHIRPYQAASGISGTFLANMRFSEVPEGGGASGWNPRGADTA